VSLGQLRSVTAAQEQKENRLSVASDLLKWAVKNENFLQN